MTKIEARVILYRAFLDGLPLSGLRRLAWHVENKTPICCGKTAHLFADGNGAACPAQLSISRHVPKRIVTGTNVDFDTKNCYVDLTYYKPRYYRALTAASESTVRAAIRDAEVRRHLL